MRKLFGWLRNAMQIVDMITLLFNKITTMLNSFNTVRVTYAFA